VLQDETNKPTFLEEKMQKWTILQLDHEAPLPEFPIFANGNTRKETQLALIENSDNQSFPPYSSSPIRFTIHKLLDAISPSHQSVFQLSLEVLVYYRCFTDI